METQNELREFIFNNFLMARNDIELQDSDSLYNNGNHRFHRRIGIG